MAIAINAQISKKVPIPGIQMSSRQASITITGEVSDLAKVGEEAARLFASAETAVDTQLQLAAASDQQNPVGRAASAAPVPNGSRGYPRDGRKAPLVTPSQLSLIDRLLRDTNTSAAGVLQHFQIGSLDQLTLKEASALIDDLKSRQSSTARA